VDGAGYIGQVQTARVWIDSWFITWSRVPVDADGQPKMEYVQPIPHATCPSYVPSVDDIGYQLIAECHVVRSEYSHGRRWTTHGFVLGDEDSVISMVLS
jgi:hypothetical protein